MTSADPKELVFREFAIAASVEMLATFPSSTSDACFVAGAFYINGPVTYLGTEQDAAIEAKAFAASR